MTLPPVDPPADPPRDAPADPPRDAPRDAPADSHDSAPEEAPADARNEVPDDALADASADQTDDAPASSATDAPANSADGARPDPSDGVPADPPDGAPVDPPADQTDGLPNAGAGGSGRAAARRQAMIEKMGAFVLTHGVEAASLRPLAKAAGTSDRMLIYHFTSKDALMAEVIAHLVQQMAGGLEALGGDVHFADADAAVAGLGTLMRSPMFAPYLGLWFDILSRATRETDGPFRATATGALDFFAGWIESRLDLPDATRRAEAQKALARIEGMLVMQAAGAEHLIPDAKSVKKR